MRALGGGLLLLALCAPARPESLEEAAQRERARRLDNQQHGVTSRSFGDADLPHSGEGEVAPEPPPPDSVPPAARPDKVRASLRSDPDDLESRRKTARRTLASAYAHIGTRGRTLLQQARTHERLCTSRWREEVPKKCDGMVARLGGLASTLALEIEAADDLGRTSWLPPGDVRQARAARIDDRSWDEIVKSVDHYVALSRETPLAPSVEPSRRQKKSGSKSNGHSSKGRP